MQMDEVIRTIERMEAENVQDVLDAVRKRHEELYPQWALVMLSLPKNRREFWRELIEQTVLLEEKCHTEK